MATTPGPEPGVSQKGKGLSALDAVEALFRDQLEERVRLPLHDALERYAHALRSIVDSMEAIPREAIPDDSVRRSPRARFDYADQFAVAFHRDILEAAGREHTEFFARLDDLADIRIEVPGSLVAGPADPDAEAPDARVRPRPVRRLIVGLGKKAERNVPTGPLARVYRAELARLLEGAAGRVASLDSVALASIRRQLHAYADPPPPDDPDAPARDEARGPVGGSEVPPEAGDGPAAPTELDAAVAAARDDIDGAVRQVVDGFSRAIRAPAVRIDETAARETLEKSAHRRERLIRDWHAFEAALRANTRSEAVLARALAALDISSERAVRELRQVLDARGRGPLDRLARALQALAQEARERLGGGAPPTPDTVESIRVKAERLFEADLPELVERLRAELKDAADRYATALAALPESVPEDLRISGESIDRIPDRPEKLELRDAPLAELLSTACVGALPRGVERGFAGAEEELEALGQELKRVRQAVDFHIRAPLRGDFEADEAAELIVGSMERAASQLHELRDSGLDAVDRMIEDLERRSREESEAVRSAVADREFLRIRSEIAEEEAVRRLSTGLDWSRRLAGTGLRIGRTGWSAGRRTFALTQSWAERQLGVGAVEREEMLESLEESLLGEEQGRVELPGLYRQLFDVESEVPWDELLVPRADELATLQRALDRWRRGHAAAVAIVGEKGSGKTTLIRAGRELFEGTPVLELELGATVPDPEMLVRRIAAALDLETTDWAELAAGMREAGPTIAVVEDAHHMFIRTLGGFEGLEAFLGLVTATRSDVFWVITADEYAWQYLDRVMGIAPHFTHTINTTSLSPELLEKAIMARHEVSGFGLRFELDDERTRSGNRWLRLRRPEPQGELTRREADRRAYFRQLNQHAEGNIFLALFYWLRSVERVDDHVLTLRSPDIIDIEFMERQPLPSLHTIAAIILHGGLSEDEHRRVFQLDAAENRLRLAALADAHLIFRARSGEYKVNKVLYRPLIRLFKSRNIF
jgi:hypothetical protein